MRRALLIALAAALAGCAAPRVSFEDEVWLGPPMELEGSLAGTVVIHPPAAD